MRRSRTRTPSASRLKRAPEDPGPRVADTYAELRQVAARLRGQLGDPTLQTTELLHETYIRLATTGPAHYLNRSYFFGTMGRAMRRTLLDRGRRRKAQKRGLDWSRVPLDEVDPAEASVPTFDRVHEALAALAAFDPRLARVVDLRFFKGYSMKEMAATLRRAESTVRRDCALATAWLSRELRG